MWTPDPPPPPPPPPPPAHDDGAAERTEPKRPWSKPSVRVMRVSVRTASSTNPKQGNENLGPLYTPSS